MTPKNIGSHLVPSYSRADRSASFSVPRSRCVSIHSKTLPAFLLISRCLIDSPPWSRLLAVELGFDDFKQGNVCSAGGATKIAVFVSGILLNAALRADEFAHPSSDARL